MDLFQPMEQPQKFFLKNRGLRGFFITSYMHLILLVDISEFEDLFQQIWTKCANIKPLKT